MDYLIKKIRGWFSPIHTDTFGWTDKEIPKSRRWDKTPSHPKYQSPSIYSLWEYVNKVGGNLKSKLCKINKFKRELMIDNKIDNELVSFDYINFNTVLIKMVRSGSISQSERDNLLKVSGLIESENGDWIQPNGYTLTIENE